jgi:hypothetical protein
MTARDHGLPMCRCRQGLVWGLAALLIGMPSVPPACAAPAAALNQAVSHFRIAVFDLKPAAEVSTVTSTTLTALIQDGLVSRCGPAVLKPGRPAPDSLDGDGELDRLRRPLGARVAVWGNVAYQADSLVTELRAMDMVTKELLFAESFASVDAAATGQVLDRLGARLQQRVGKPLDRGELLVEGGWKSAPRGALDGRTVCVNGNQPRAFTGVTGRWTMTPRLQMLLAKTPPGQKAVAEFQQAAKDRATLKAWFSGITAVLGSGAIATALVFVGMESVGLRGFEAVVWIITSGILTGATGVFGYLGGVVTLPFHEASVLDRAIADYNASMGWE